MLKDKKMTFGLTVPWNCPVLNGETLENVDQYGG